MKTAVLNGKTIDLSSTLLPFSKVREEVQLYGAICAACHTPVIFRSGPIKGPHFAHKERSDDCQYYHSSFAKEEELPQYMIDAIALFKPILKRQLSDAEKEQIHLWFHMDEYQLSEMRGALTELISEAVPDQLFKRMDAKLFSITRSKNNLYFERGSRW